MHSADNSLHSKYQDYEAEMAESYSNDRLEEDAPVEMPQDLQASQLDAIKDGLNELKLAGDIYGFKFTSVRLTNRELEDPSLVEDFCDLKSIDISNNCLNSIRTLGTMPHLQKINASKNLIEKFLDMASPPLALKEVNLSFNKINTIVSLKKFWALTDIDLSHNELTVIDGFSKLGCLQVLNLSHNKIHTIRNLDCPNLLILYLNSNELESMTKFMGCSNLRYINLNRNKISKIKGLKYINELTELHIEDNNIEDISELENLKPLLSLTHIRLKNNPITSFEHWELVLIHMLPQILWVDGQRLEASDLRAAENIFNPSFKKIAFVNHTTILLDRACQSANTIFDDHCRMHPFPPILLLVGPPQSKCNELALLLKQKFRNKVYLGGVHSTATTIEGSNPKLDIPVSYESYKDMKNRGEFLATSQIIGRVCGFATSQIARAAEKGALLVAAVPLTTAISLRAMNLRPKLILVLPSNPPEFPIDELRIETIKRSIENDPYETRDKKDHDDDDDDIETEQTTDPLAEFPIDESKVEKSKRQSNENDVPSDIQGKTDYENEKTETEQIISDDQQNVNIIDNKCMKMLSSNPHEGTGDGDELEIETIKRNSENYLPETDDKKEYDCENVEIEQHTSDHVNFAEMLSVVPSLEKDLKVLFYQEPKEPNENLINQHSILRTPHFELESFDEPHLETKKIKAPVKIAESEPLVIEEHEHESHHLSHKEALTSSILQSRWKYAEFHHDNPGFFHVVVDASDISTSYNIIESIANDGLIKYKKESQESNLKSSVKSHAGMNQLDEKKFLAERMKHFKECAAIWSRGYYDGVNSGMADRRLNNDQPCEIFFEKTMCPQTLLDPTIPRPSITFKMKKIAELHDKRSRYHKKN